MKKEIILKGKGFIVRPYKKGDDISLKKYAKNKTIFKNYVTYSISSDMDKEVEKFINMSVVKKYNEKSKFNFVIDIDGVAVGVIGGYVLQNKKFIFSFGYWLGAKYWGKGIASEAVKLYTKYIFKNFKDIQRIETTVSLWNRASKRVLEKNGFKLEGILRKNNEYRGKIIDKYLFSKLRND